MEKLQDILNNAKVNERFKSSDSLEILNLQDEVHQYLYTDGANVHLLHPATFEELEMPLDTCEGGEDAASLLEDGMNIAVSFLTTPDLGRQPVVFKLPTTHIFTVESVIERAGQAAKGTVYMTAHLVNGTKIQVPEFVNAGDRIVVDIEKMRYMKREL
ncbi:hypothetical protein BDF14DRAFT_1744757 [Spinellus fusiger]|nr:hypothetical protein BDF14DRAFT_1744757 [Spinellus fusiger]